MTRIPAPPEGILEHTAPVSPRQRCGASCVPEKTHSLGGEPTAGVGGGVSWKAGGPLLDAGVGKTSFWGPFVVDEWTRDF